MKLTTLYMPEKMYEAIDELVKKKIVPNRSEFIRLAVRDLLIVHRKWGISDDFKGVILWQERK